MERRGEKRGMERKRKDRRGEERGWEGREGERGNERSWGEVRGENKRGGERIGEEEKEGLSPPQPSTYSSYQEAMLPVFLVLNVLLHFETKT